MALRGCSLDSHEFGLMSNVFFSIKGENVYLESGCANVFTSVTLMNLPRLHICLGSIMNYVDSEIMYSWPKRFLNPES